MPTVQQGPRGTIDLLEDLIVQEMLRRVAVLETSARPFTTMLMQLDKVMESDTAEPQHAEDEMLPMVDLVQGAVAATTTNVSFDNPAFFLVGDVLHFPRTGENARVTAAPGVNPLTLRRGVGNTPPANLLDDEVVWILGGASEEGATSRLALNTLEIPFTTRLQIVRNSMEGTGTQMATRQLGGDFEDQAEKKLMEHKRQLEYFVKFGRQGRDTVSGQFMRFMQGFFERVQTNVFAINGVLEEGTFETFGEMASGYGNQRKLGLASPTAARAINNFARNRMYTVPQDEAYGLNLRRYEFSSGLSLDICVDRELKGTVYGGYLAVVDPDYALIRYLRAGPGSGRPEKYQGSAFCKRIENIQANDADRRRDEFFSELGVQWIHERVHAVATGITG